MLLTDPLRYDNLADVHRRLHHTIVLYKGYPVYVTGAFENLFIEGVSFKNWNGDIGEVPTFKTHSSDVEIDLESPRLGWANVYVRSSTRPVYFLRTVHRQFSQGIDPRKMSWFDPTKIREDGDLAFGFSWKAYSDLLPIAKMMVNEGYPSISKAAESKVGAAFDRDWAILPTKSDNFRTVYNDHQPVATFNRSSNMFVFVAGSLTKTRRASLSNVLHSAQNKEVHYGMDEINP